MSIEESTYGNHSKKRGRPRIKRRMGESGPWRCYAPQCNTGEDVGSISFLPEEIELLRLIDLEGMEQESSSGARCLPQDCLKKTSLRRD